MSSQRRGNKRFWKTGVRSLAIKKGIGIRTWLIISLSSSLEEANDESSIMGWKHVVSKPQKNKKMKKMELECCNLITSGKIKDKNEDSSSCQEEVQQAGEPIQIRCCLYWCGYHFGGAHQPVQSKMYLTLQGISVPIFWDQRLIDMLEWGWWC